MLSHKTLVMLIGYDPEERPDVALPKNQPHVTLAYTKHLWVAQEKQKAYQKLSEFVAEYAQSEAIDDITVDEKKRLLARCYLKIGAWQETLQGINENSIPSILKCYKQATEHDPKWYKAWHAWAYMNFATVLFYNPLKDKTSYETVLAVQGFFK